MSLDQLAMMLYLAATAQLSTDSTAVAILVAIFALQFAVMLILRRVFRPDDADGDDTGSGGDGPGWRRGRGPRKPPPDEPVCWPKFERQFAEHVASLDARERASTRTRRCVGGHRPDGVMTPTSRASTIRRSRRPSPERDR